MTYFAQLSLGILAERGSTFDDAYETSKTDAAVAKSAAWSWIGAGLVHLPVEPLGKWTLPHSQLTDADRRAARLLSRRAAGTRRSRCWTRMAI